MRAPILALLLAVGLSAAQQPSPMPASVTAREPNLGIYAMELGGGLVGALGVGGTFAVVSLFYPAWIDDERPIHLSPPALGAISGSLALVGLASGICITGKAFDQEGKFLPTLAYATATSATGLGLFLASSALFRSGSMGKDGYYAMRYTGTALFIATPLAAVYGYNRSRPKEPTEGGFLPSPVSTREPNFGIYAAEASGALAGALVGAGLGWAAGTALYYTGIDGSLAALAGGLAGVTAVTTGCAGGTYVVGNAFRQDGRYLPTLAWTAGTVAVGAGLVFVSNRSSVDLTGVGVAVLAATPIVATYGYNRSRPKETVGGRFLPGSVALGSVTDADGLAHPALDVRLVNVRF